MAFLSKASTANYYLYWPEVIALTLKPKAYTSTTADTFATSVACPTCRKREATSEEKSSANLLATDTSVAFEIWDRGQAAPRPEDVLVDSDGVNWNILKVKTEIFGNLYICTCVKGL